jgi:hypothetical protein
MEDARERGPHHLTVPEANAREAAVVDDVVDFIWNARGRKNKGRPEERPLFRRTNCVDEKCYFLLRQAAKPIPAIPVPRRRRDVGSGT